MSRIEISQKTLVILIACAFVMLGAIVGIILWRVNQQAQLSSEESHAGGVCEVDMSQCNVSSDYDCVCQSGTKRCKRHKCAGGECADKPGRCCGEWSEDRNGESEWFDTGESCTTPGEPATPTCKEACTQGCDEGGCHATCEGISREGCCGYGPATQVCNGNQGSCGSTNVEIGQTLMGGFPDRGRPESWCKTYQADTNCSADGLSNLWAIMWVGDRGEYCYNTWDAPNTYHCEPSSISNPDQLDWDCTEEPPPSCNDGTCDSGEACEPNGQKSCDKQLNGATCRDDCTFCGDEVIQSGEQCESGNPSGTSCTWDACNHATCGCPSANPNWSINKSASMDCEDEDTEDPHAVVSYKIEVTYTAGGASGSGVLNRVVDRPSDEVECDWLVEGSIDPSFGVVNCQDEKIADITWELSGNAEWSEFDDGETKVFKYEYKIDEDDFDSYANIATAYPKEGKEITDNETVFVTCRKDGLFDTTVSRVGLGLFLVALGIIYRCFAWEKSLIKFNWLLKEGIEKLPDIRIKFVDTVERSRESAQKKKIMKSRNKFEKKMTSRRY